MAALLALLLLHAAPATAAGNPAERWHTLHTDHFRIHYESRNERLARRLAVLAEESHLQLVPVFGLPFEPPVEVVVLDDIDTANGSARAIDYNLIRVYAYAPEADSTLGDADDWLRGLFVHEYIHILHVNQISGVWEVLNAVFGKTYAPNQLLPRWYVEGLATWGESTFLEGGRLRNNAYRMFLRMAALEGDFASVDRLAGVPHRWPGATGWYLYGSDFVDYVARTRGAELWLAFNERVGGALSPIAVNQHARAVFGNSVLELWDEYTAAALGEFRAEAVAVTARGLTPVELLTTSGHTSGYPRCRSPFEVAYVQDDGYSQRRITTTHRVSGETRTVVDVHGEASFDWLPGGQALVFAQGARHLNVYFYNDLFLHDLVTGTTTRLTHGERAREPAVSPDGRRVAYIATNDRGGVDLRELELGTGATRTLFRADDWELASAPAYAPDGETLAFSMWRLDLARDIFLVDRVTGELTPLTDDRAQDLDPSFSPDGREVYFASDRDGIYNAYAVSLDTGRVRRLTNVLGGAFSPRRCAEDGPLFVRVYGAEGFDVGSVAQTLDHDAPPSYERPEVDYPTLEEATVIREETRYNPWRGLLPRSWSPVVSQDAEGVLLGISVAAVDPAAFHAWAGTVTWGLASEQWGLALNYVYTKLPFDLSLFFSRFEARITDRLIRQTRFLPFEEETLNAGFSLSFPLGDSRSGHSLGLTYALRNVRPTDLPDVRDDPGDIQPVLPESGRFDSVSFGWVWSDAHGFRYSLGAESGTVLSAGFTVRSPLTGSDFESVTFGWTLRHYLKNPWWRGQHLALLLTGGVGRASFERRPLFAVGGFPDQDILQALLDQIPVGAGFLRGYEPLAQIGRQFHVLNAEYRIPLFEPDVGAWTLPFFVQRFYFTVFADYGTAVPEWEGFGSFLLGVGAEVRMQSWLGYTVPADFRIGYARGLSEGGIDHFYVLYGATF
jgi:hypothetical protein